jgi:uracil-DNA glycosylase
MAETNDVPGQLRRHLEFYGELGVAGASTDPTWRLPVDASSAVEPAAGVMEPSVPARSALPAPTYGSLEELRSHIGPTCTRCKLGGLGRRQVVFGVGNPDADLMFVGEAPGADEDAQGEPFVGRAGQLLTRIIEAMGFRRGDVYIANVVKCRPPENRNPEPDEIATCEPFLVEQIALVRPRVIVALGTCAAHALLRTDTPISRLRGRIFPYHGAQLIPTFHPAYLLRSPDKKRETWEDMKKVCALLSGEAR